MENMKGNGSPKIANNNENNGVGSFQSGNDMLNTGFISNQGGKDQERTLSLSPSKPSLRGQNISSIDSSTNLITVESRVGVEIDGKPIKSKVLGNMQSPSVLRRN
jgi:hypothetical protein